MYTYYWTNLYSISYVQNYYNMKYMLILQIHFSWKQFIAHKIEKNIKRRHYIFLYHSNKRNQNHVGKLKVSTVPYRTFYDNSFYGWIDVFLTWFYYWFYTRIQRDTSHHTLNAIKYFTSFFPICLSAYQKTISSDSVKELEYYLVWLLM